MSELAPIDSIVGSLVRSNSGAGDAFAVVSDDVVPSGVHELAERGTESEDKERHRKRGDSYSRISALDAHVRRLGDTNAFGHHCLSDPALAARNGHIMPKLDERAAHSWGETKMDV